MIFPPEMKEKHNKTLQGEIIHKKFYHMIKHATYNLYTIHQFFVQIYIKFTGN